MKILIIGSNSVVAKYLQEKLIAHHLVKKMARNNSDYNFDLTFWDSIPNIGENFDVIIHVAAFFGSNQPSDLINSELVNSVGILKSCQIALNVNAQHLIYISSISTLYDEEHPYFNSYSLSKKHAEDNLRYFCKVHDLNFTILRPSQLYGANKEFMRHQGLLYSFMEQAQKGEEIKIYGKNDALRNYLHIDDFTEVCMRVMEKKIFGEYDLVHPDYITLSALAETAFKTFGLPHRVRFVSEKPDIPNLPEISSYKLYEIIDYQPKIGMQEGLNLIKELEIENNG